SSGGAFSELFSTESALRRLGAPELHATEASLRPSLRRLVSPCLLAIVPEAAHAAASTEMDSSGIFQVLLVVVIIGVAVGLVTFAKPEQEEWQKELDEVMTAKEWERSDGANGLSICQKCGRLCGAYCSNCSGLGGTP
ncbi:unnamed protein product, partial [Polarella glacialis]